MGKIAVTGGSGFIGSHLVGALLGKHEVLVVDKRKPDGNGPAGAAFIQMDIRDDLGACFAGCDAIYHLAADPSVSGSSANPAGSFADNVVGTFNVLEAARKNDVGQVVFASTSAVYGNAKMPTKEDAPIAPASNYGASKAAGEAYIRAYSECYGIKASALRYANIFGEGSGHGVMHDFFRKLSANPARLEILGDGKQQKSFMYVKDAVFATVLVAGKQGGKFEAFNVGSENCVNVDELARLVASEMGLSPSFMHTGGQAWKGDVPMMLLDISKLKKLGFAPKYSFEQGLKNYVGWLKSG